MSVNPEQFGFEDDSYQVDSKRLELLETAADFVSEYPTLSRLRAGDSPGERGDMVNRIANLYEDVDKHLAEAETYDIRSSELNFYLSRTPVPTPTDEQRGWLTIAVIGTKMPSGEIDYRRFFDHRSKWELWLAQINS